MELDNTTYNDLSIFHTEEDQSVFNKLNFTRTGEGREWLRKFFRAPFSDVSLIDETQRILRLMLDKMPQWPSSITNGTIMVITRFFESGIDTIPGGSNAMNAYQYKLFHGSDYSLLKYSLGHFADFLRGMRELTALFDHDSTPRMLRIHLQRASDLIGRTVAEELSHREAGKVFSVTETVHYGHFARYQFKNAAFELIGIYGRLDAWFSMAVAMKEYAMVFPEFVEARHPAIDAQGLYHLLLPHPVPYDISMNKDAHFIFLTGANMAGKSTFIRAVGCAVFLAHLGMGVPAQKMRLCVFDGLLSNINVVDNIMKGESYFFNEVQRIKKTIVKINDQRKWLVLIDELFKGTNVQDAMKCSCTVIRGLIKISNSLFILSTHLYEIGEELKQFPSISFKFFETAVLEDQLEFSYQLKEGISNDRLGYVILKREKVVELLEKL